MEGNQQMKPLSFFTKYSTQGASSRYRHFNYFYKLQSCEYSLEIDSFLDSDYLISLYAKQPISKTKILLSYFKRLFSAARAAENVVVEYELFPYLPYFIERLFLRKRRYILNFDDNVWDNYKDRWLLKHKYDLLVKNAAGVIVANQFLYEKVMAINSSCIAIPTTIDLDSFANEQDKFDTFTLVWIGTPVTYRYIESHQEIFQELAQRMKYRLLIVASKQLETKKIQGVEMEFVDWSAQTEAYYLQRSHIGVMPLDEDSFSQGKSSFKLIQYLAAGIPLVGSAIGENKRVVKHEINGFLAHSPTEWIESVEKLYSSALLREAFARNCKKDAYEYSIQKHFPLYRAFLEKIFV
jgi:glycosyltransferase involved in cell wall biosynthesis